MAFQVRRGQPLTVQVVFPKAGRACQVALESSVTTGSGTDVKRSVYWLDAYATLVTQAIDTPVNTSRLALNVTYPIFWALWLLNESGQNAKLLGMGSLSLYVLP